MTTHNDDDDAVVPFRLRIRRRMKLLLHLTDDKTETRLFMCVRLGCRKIRSILLLYPQFPPLSGTARNSPRIVYVYFNGAKRKCARILFETHMLVKYRCAGGWVAWSRVEIAIRPVHGRERESDEMLFILFTTTAHT